MHVCLSQYIDNCQFPYLKKFCKFEFDLCDVRTTKSFTFIHRVSVFVCVALCGFVHIYMLCSLFIHISWHILVPLLVFYFHFQSNIPIQVDSNECNAHVVLGKYVILHPLQSIESNGKINTRNLYHHIQYICIIRKHTLFVLFEKKKYIYKKKVKIPKNRVLSITSKRKMYFLATVKILCLFKLVERCTTCDCHTESLFWNSHPKNRGLYRWIWFHLKDFTIENIFFILISTCLIEFPTIFPKAIKIW